MAGTPPLGTAGHADLAQGRQRHLLCRAGVRRPPGTPRRVRGRRRAAGRRFFGARAARPGFYPYQTHPPAPTGDQPATAAGEVGVHQESGTLPPLTPPYAGPYAVAEAGEKTFEVLVGGQQQRISVDRLKPHTGPAPVTTAPPARRGRPPKERTAVVAATTRTYAEVVAGGGSL